MRLLPRALAPMGQALRNVSASHKIRRLVFIILISIALFGALLFFGAPILIKHVAEEQLSQLIHRPVSVGQITLNPYTLKLQITHLNIGEPNATPATPSTTTPFISIDRLVMRPSWSSVVRLKPIIDEVYLNGPAVHLVRYAENRFNFSDLVQQFSQPTPTSTPNKPLLFSVSNIQVKNGRIDFDDHVLKTHHTIDQWQLGIPFIANLPAKTNIFVKPQLHARVDGSPLAIDGKTKPFSKTLLSSIDINLDQFDLTRLKPYLPYAFPNGVPVDLQQGHLTSRLNVAFEQVAKQAVINLSGILSLHDLQLLTPATPRSKNQPFFSSRLIAVQAQRIDPLHNVVHLAIMRIVDPALSIEQNKQGQLNVLRIFSSPPAHKPARPAKTTAAAPLNLSIDQFNLVNGRAQFQDDQLSKPVHLTVDSINLAANRFSTVARQDMRYTLQAQLQQGGSHTSSLNSEGSVNLAAHQLAAKLSIDQLSLPALQPWLSGSLNGKVTSGSLAGNAVMSADWSKATPIVKIAPATLTVRALRLVNAAASAKTPALLELKQAQAQLAQADLASHQIALTALTFDGLTLRASRNKQGVINLAQLLRIPQTPATHRSPHRSHHSARPLHAALESSPPPANTAAATIADTTANTISLQPVSYRVKKSRASNTDWHYKIGALKFSAAQLYWQDLTQAKPVSLKLAPLQVSVSQISDKLNQPWQINVNGTLNKRGHFATRGSIVVQPLAARLKLNARNLDIAAFEPYFGADLNAVIASALFSAAGTLDLAQTKQRKEPWRVSYRGNAALNRVHMLDRVTTDRFAGWQNLNIDRIQARYDARGPAFSAGRILLNQFYARIILDKNGKLNLSNFTTRPEQSPTSLTRDDTESTAANTGTDNDETRSSTKPGTAGSRKTLRGKTKRGLPIDLRFGQLVLRRGHVNYTDHFIQPNFTANLVDINGRIGAFGTRTRQAATVNVRGSLDHRGPIAINGTVNPLIVQPTLNMLAKARGIQLNDFTPYSTKYTGYPIVAGRLNVDLHYQLAKSELKANNHLFIDQFTFGNRVESSSALHLPFRLAVALLKNSRGQIDVNIPVSGSLNHPHFSFGRLIWTAIVHLLEKAVTSPFTLLSHAFGGSEELSYVEFPAGSATLTPAAEKKLDLLTKALIDKPGVKLDMSGRADPATDGPALRQAYVDKLVRLQKAKDLVGHGQSIAVDDIQVSKDEYDKYLTRAYRAAHFKKPRNFIGLTKSLPAADMTRLIEQNADLGDNALRELAQQRVAAVHQFFTGKISPDRLYDVAPHLDAKGINDKGTPSRVDFALK